jgi:hypothetical protein
MVGVWLLFGVVVGANSWPSEEGLVGVVAGATAGLLVLPWLGAVLGLLGGRAPEALVGGLWGLAVGAAAGLAAGEGEVLRRASAGLVGGGLVGATFPGVYRLLLAGWLDLLRACLRQEGTGLSAPPGPA